MQREQAAKLSGQQGGGVVRPIGVAVAADSTTNVPPSPSPQSGEGVQQPLVVNAKTKTALANMLSIRLQSGGANLGGETLPEPSAAGTLR